jgi:hypothetical protein
MTNSRRGSSLLQSPESNNQHNRLHILRERSSKKKRQELDLVDSVDSLITVIQTVSLVQIVDAAGNPIEVQTVFPPPATVLVDPISGVTVDLPLPDVPIPTDVPGLLPDLLNTAEPSITSQDPSLTSTPSTSSSAFPTLSGPFNLTNG